MIRAVVAVLCVATIVAADNLALRGAEKCQGVCQDVTLKGCNAGNYVAGRCPGKKNIQCCVPTPKPAASTGNDGVGAKCKTGPGVCQLTNTQCAGTFVSGLCPGKGNVQCCQPKPERPITRPSTPTPTPVQPQPQPQPQTPTPAGKWPVTFSSLWQKYPHGEAADVKRRIGGNINADYITNTCVVRVTRAMVASGMTIDGGFKLANGKNILLVKGGDQKGLAIRVAEFKQYVAKRIGAPDIKVVNAGDGTAQIPAQFMGKKGMIMFDVRVWNDATGHFDLWDGNACAHNCYWDKAKEVWLWEIA